MRIMSLLPSATEIVYALGLEDHLVGLTDECDWPPQARTVQVVSRSALPAAEPAEIDRLVSASVGGGQPLYRLDTAAIRDLRPDLVLSQDLCAVCAVPSGHVNQALDVLGCQAEVISLDPSSLGDVLDGVLQVGKAGGVPERAEEVVAGLRERLASVRAAVDGLERPRVFALEWGDPPFNGGHWVPEMLAVAGAEAVLACPGTRRPPSKLRRRCVLPRRSCRRPACWPSRSAAPGTTAGRSRLGPHKLQGHAVAGCLPAELIGACQQLSRQVGEDHPAGSQPAGVLA
jgi:iron complex transport system substrate-binding protein